jgi:Fe-S-cluster containining protein
MSNSSRLANSETCSECGRCCQSFRFWLPKFENMSERINLLEGVKSKTIFTDGIESSELVQIEHECMEYDKTKKTCNIYGSKGRPKLCNTFPDNLFDTNEDDQIILNNDHAKFIISTYSDYCLAIYRLGLEEGSTAPPPAPPF